MCHACPSWPQCRSRRGHVGSGATLSGSPGAPWLRPGSPAIPSPARAGWEAVSLQDPRLSAPWLGRCSGYAGMGDGALREERSGQGEVRTHPHPQGGELSMAQAPPQGLWAGHSTPRLGGLGENSASCDGRRRAQPPVGVTVRLGRGGAPGSNDVGKGAHSSPLGRYLGWRASQRLREVLHRATWMPRNGQAGRSGASLWARKPQASSTIVIIITRLLWGASRVSHSLHPTPPATLPDFIH